MVRGNFATEISFRLPAFHDRHAIKPPGLARVSFELPPPARAMALPCRNCCAIAIKFSVRMRAAVRSCRHSEIFSNCERAAACTTALTFGAYTSPSSARARTRRDS